MVAGSIAQMEPQVSTLSELEGDPMIGLGVTTHPERMTIEQIEPFDTARCLQGRLRFAHSGQARLGLIEAFEGAR